MNEDKRKAYDRYGEDALRDGGASQHHGGMEDLLGGLFGMGGRGQQQRGPRKGKSVMNPIKCTLEDLYKGKNQKIAINRERICSKCDGKGGKEGAVQSCSSCNGRGMKTTMTMVGPGMYSQRTGPCDDCGGQGEQIDEKNRCKDCNGKKTQKERKIIEVQIDKGSPNGERYVFHGEADQHPDMEPGDVVIQVQEQPHKTFKRKGADLLFEKEITLLEALTGVDFVLTHLDGRKIRIKNEPGQVVKPEDIKTVEGFGMPFHKTSYKFGNLFVLFKIKFPESLQQEQVGPIRESLIA